MKFTILCKSWFWWDSVKTILILDQILSLIYLLFFIIFLFYWKKLLSRFFNEWIIIEILLWFWEIFRNIILCLKYLLFLFKIILICYLMLVFSKVYILLKFIIWLYILYKKLIFFSLLSFYTLEKFLL